MGGGIKEELKGLSMCVAVGLGGLIGASKEVEELLCV